MLTLDRFKNIQTRREFAECIGCEYKNLVYYLYKFPTERKYNIFEIPKKSGGVREISSPVSGLKYLQTQLASVLQDITHPKYCAYAYIKGKNIKRNASVHRHKKIIVNLDLEDFFGSINFGRVRGLFLSAPYELNEEVATTIAQLCCYNGKLPQGAPTSPVISNMICRKLDNNLLNFAKGNKLEYTRYADDITFSTQLTVLPDAVGRIEGNRLILSDELKEIITSNGFSINEHKVRYSDRLHRQEVTGLIVNEMVNVPRSYVKRVSAMVHAWGRWGKAAAAKEHFEKYKKFKKNAPKDLELSFERKVIGMLSYIGYVKGLDSVVYSNLYRKLMDVYPKAKIRKPLFNVLPEDITYIYCEGKTDIIHLNAAFKHFKENGEFKELKISFFEYPNPNDVGNSALLQILKNRKINKLDARREIYLFDRDCKSINDEVANPAEGKDYKCWGNNVYSALLPRPSHRMFDEICIEFYYEDSTLKQADEKGYRLYTSDEFDPQSGMLIKDANIYFADSHGKLKSKYPKILDDKVFKKSTDKNIAMSKKDFANNIRRQKGNFQNIDFSHFEPLFLMLAEIVNLK